MRKILFNRDEPDTHEIRKRQDFDLVIKKYQKRQDFWKNPCFYGSIGLASIISSLFLMSL